MQICMELLFALLWSSWWGELGISGATGLPGEESDMITAIINGRLFDGEHVLEDTTVVLNGTRIAAVGGEPPAGANIVDARGGTLLPGLFDAHVHTSEEALALALRFGITTELEMQGMNTKASRAHITENDSLADVRSAGFGITPPGGHPSELMPEDFKPEGRGEPDDRGDRPGPHEMPLMPFSTTPEEAVAFVPQLVAAGSDYIKFMVDDGTVEGHPGLPMLDQATLTAGVAETHRHGMLAIAHTLTVDATRMAIEAGIDGFAHLFMDQPHTDEIIDLIAASGAFVVPCVVLNASMMGITGASLTEDPRVSSRLNEAWTNTLNSSYNRYPQGKLEDVLASVKALHDVGVDLMVGTDAAPYHCRSWAVWSTAPASTRSSSTSSGPASPRSRPCARRPSPRHAASAWRTVAASPRACGPTCCSWTATPPPRSATPSTCVTYGAAAPAPHSRPHRNLRPTSDRYPATSSVAG